MKAFNLEEYLKNPSKKVVTKEGKTVKRILCTDARGNYPIIALIDEGLYDNALSYTKDGRLYAGESNVYDLFFAPEKHEGWGVICGSFLAGEIFTAKEEAEEFVKRAQSKDFVAIAKIEWEE